MASFVMCGRPRYLRMYDEDGFKIGHDCEVISVHREFHYSDPYTRPSIELEISAVEGDENYISDKLKQITKKELTYDELKQNTTVRDVFDSLTKEQKNAVYGLIGNMTKEQKNTVPYPYIPFPFTPKYMSFQPRKIIQNGPAFIVFWNDGSKTVLKKRDSDFDDPYAAFAQALMKRMWGTTSHAHKIVDRCLTIQKPKNKKNNNTSCTEDACEINLEVSQNG